MSQFRMVILDYAKAQLRKQEAQKALGDLIFVKQKNFERTDPDYVVLDKHDMIGTHIMIYETSALFDPKLIFALRVTYEDRAAKHKLRTPLQELVPHLNEGPQELYRRYRKNRPVLADCNSWFVDPNFSQKASGLRLSDIGYLGVYLQVKRMGFDHIAGCTNEKYRASRWLENIGYFERGFEFVHPTVPDPHMLVLIEKFNEPYLLQVYREYQSLFHEALEIVPEQQEYIGFSEILKRWSEQDLVRQKVA